MKIIFVLLFLFSGLLSCSSTKMIDQWKNPEINQYKSDKVLVIGITPDTDTRRVFERELATAFEKKGIIAVKSIDFFEHSFSEAKKSEMELNEIENQLIEAGFDTVLFATVTGSENKVSAVQSYKDFSRTFESFRDYYFGNQHVFYNEHQREIYQIFHTETALYCVCPGKGRELQWKGFIDIVDPQKMERSVSDYVKILIRELKKQQLLVIEP